MKTLFHRGKAIYIYTSSPLLFSTTTHFVSQIFVYMLEKSSSSDMSCKYAENINTLTDKEWYFFCKRGRKYRNSIRPNRVTRSGFWKATGIDKPIYSNNGEGHDCIGLKKSLVYYRGSAGKGTKTDWMMHEFRLPANQKNTNLPNAKAADQEAVRKKINNSEIYTHMN